MVNISKKPTVNNPNAGLTISGGDDNTTGSNILDLVNSFAQGVTPISTDWLNVSGSQYSALTGSSDYDLTSSASGSNGPVLQFQAIPNLGTAPTAEDIQSATAQWQSQIQSIGADATPGMPVVDLNTNMDGLAFTGTTEAFENSVVPYLPGADGQGQFYPSVTGGGRYFEPPQIQAPDGDTSTINSPQFVSSPFDPNGYVQTPTSDINGNVYSTTPVNLPAQVPPAQYGVSAGNLYYDTPVLQSNGQSTIYQPTNGNAEFVTLPQQGLEAAINSSSSIIPYQYPQGYPISEYANYPGALNGMYA